jgi:hypothetical protein
MIWLLLMLGCVAHVQRTGLVITDKGQATLLELDGTQTRLIVAGEALALARLGGCTVAVEGRRGGGGFRVMKWEVQDAGFGSQPFIGRLRAVGNVLFLDDRTTGSTLRLEGGGDASIRKMAGGIVMVEGLIVGGHVLKVVTWRGLLTPSGGPPG